VESKTDQPHNLNKPLPQQSTPEDIKMRRVLQSLRERKHSRNPRDRASERPIDSLPVLPRFTAPVLAGPLRLPSASDGPFFRLLPAELRREILVHAFGGRTIHLDLFYTYADIRTPHTTADTELCHARAWRWRVWSCHRHPSAPAILCQCPSGAAPTDCAAHWTPCAVRGLASGWLRASRRAYAEGVEVLYGSNTFFVTSGAPLLRTQHLLARPAAAAVRSLVVCLGEANLREETREFLGARWEGDASWYAQLVLAVREGFPGLRRLEIGLLDSLLFTGSLRGERWLHPVDDLIIAYGAQLEDVQVTVQSGFFSSLFGLSEDGEVDEDSAEEASTGGSRTPPRMAVWRPALPRSDREPTLLRNSPTASGALGYWIKSIPYSTDVKDLLPISAI